MSSRRAGRTQQLGRHLGLGAASARRKHSPSGAREPILSAATHPGLFLRSTTASSPSTAEKTGSVTREWSNPPFARPLNLGRYGNPDAAALAADYAWGLARNHGFIDGNKGDRLGGRPPVPSRTTANTSSSSLWTPSASWKGVAADRIDEATLADWFRSNIKR